MVGAEMNTAGQKHNKNNVGYHSAQQTTAHFPNESLVVFSPLTPRIASALWCAVRCGVQTARAPSSATMQPIASARRAESWSQQGKRPKSARRINAASPPLLNARPAPRPAPPSRSGPAPGPHVPHQCPEGGPAPPSPYREGERDQPDAPEGGAGPGPGHKTGKDRR
jgi:hypothetical protein